MLRWRKRIAGLSLALALVFPGMLLVAGALEPDYSLFNAVSSLGAPDATMPGLVNVGGFGLAGVLMAVFVAAVWPVFRGDVLGVATAVFSGAALSLISSGPDFYRSVMCP